jgi:hypothetical protein
MDRVHPLNPLDGSHSLRSGNRLRHSLHIPAMLQLHHRFLPHVVSIPVFILLLLTIPLTAPHSAASAIAANTLLRSIAGAGFPLFAVQMFNNLGIQWAGTLLGCLAAVMIPIPVIFYLYGSRIRARSKFAPARAEGAVETGDEEKGVWGGGEVG